MPVAVPYAAGNERCIKMHFAQESARRGSTAPVMSDLKHIRIDPSFSQISDQIAFSLAFYVTREQCGEGPVFHR